MARRNYSNSAVATALASGITPSATTLTVNSASGYPTVPFTIRCEFEIILVGAKSGTTFSSLTRGFDGTAAVSHTAGALVEHRAVAEDFSFRRIDPVNDKTSTNSFSDHFDDASLASAWQSVTPTGSATWTEGKDVLSVKCVSQASQDCAGLIKSLGALSYPVVLTTAIRQLSVPNFGMAGLLFSNGVTSAANVIWAMPYFDTSAGFNHSFRTGTFDNISSVIITERRNQMWSGWLYQRLIWRATNTWSYEVSPDGVTWTDYGNGNETFAMTPTHFGFGVSSWGSTLDQIASFEYFDVSDVLP